MKNIQSFIANISGAISIRRKFTLQKEAYSHKDFDEAMRFLQHGLSLHSRYGGKIFAVSRVIGAPEYYAHLTRNFFA